MVELYLQVNAHPRNEGGLAPTSYERYEETVNRHLRGKPRRRPKGGTLAPKPYALAVAAVPAVSFNGPQAPRAWREQMVREGASKATRNRAWRVLSAALSWAVASDLVPEIEINGCSLASKPRGNKRRSLRSGGTGYAPAPRRHGPAVPSWALSPQAVEAIRAQLLLRVKARGQILARRDAMIVSLQYGLGARNQEVWALRWSSLAGTLSAMPDRTKEESSLELIPLPAIQKRIVVVRKRHVMVDEDLAELYGVQTGRLIEQVKRNIDRFPSDFMFQLTKDEAAAFEIAICDLKGRARRTSLRPLCLHGAGRGDAVRRSPKPDGGRRQHRDHASVR